MDNTSYHLKANFTLGNLSHTFSALDSSINCHVNAAGCFFDVLYLLVLCVVGTVGNLLLIFSIIYTRRVNKSGNILFIHLAGVDLLITSFIIPIGIANLVSGKNVLSDRMCVAAGYILCLSCACSVSTLACIAFNRYCSVVKHHSSGSIFDKRSLCLVVLLNWLWANLLVMPTLFGWSQQCFDEKVMFCTFDVSKSPTYNIFIMILGIGLPMLITAYSYWKLFGEVLKSNQNVRKWSIAKDRPRNHLDRTQLQRERNFARTLFVTVLALLLCYMPFGTSILVDQQMLSFVASKVVGRLLLTNFTMNFVIYGAINPVYRQGYVALINNIMCFKQTRKVAVKTSDNSAGSSSTRSATSSGKKVRTLFVTKAGAPLSLCMLAGFSRLRKVALKKNYQFTTHKLAKEIMENLKVPHGTACGNQPRSQRLA